MARKRDGKRRGGGSQASQQGSPAAPSGSPRAIPESLPAADSPAASPRDAAAVTTGGQAGVDRLRAAGRSPAVDRSRAGRGMGSLTATSRGRRSQPRTRQQAIPDAVANRMARRIAMATGIPTVMGMGVFIASYLVVSRGLMDIPPGVTLVASGACFLLGLLGLSYGVLASSWEEAPGSLLGVEQISLNIGRIRDSIRAMRQGASSASGGGPQG